MSDFDTDSKGRSPDRPSTVDDVATLLRSLPRDEASLGFEDRVLRRVRRPTKSTGAARGVRLALPLLAAAVLGFVFGPELFQRLGPSTAPAVADAEVSRDSAPASSPPARQRVVPQVAPGAQLVSMGGDQAPDPRVPRIRAEAERVRRELEELRQVRRAVDPTVTFQLEDGVEIQMDLRDLLALLQQQARSAGGPVGEPTDSTLADPGTDTSPKAPPLSESAHWSLAELPRW